VDALGREILEFPERAAAVVVRLHHCSDVLLRDDDRRGHVRLLDLLDIPRELGRVVHFEPAAVLLLHAVGDIGRGHEQVEVELALEPLADDLHVEHTEEAAAKPKPSACDVSAQHESGVVELAARAHRGARDSRPSRSGRCRRRPSASRPGSREAACLQGARAR
jgi:hypothetical protein